MFFARRKRVKFPPIFKKECALLARAVGLAEASRMTGVKFRTLQDWRWHLDRADGLPYQHKPCKYTPTQKIQCIKLAIALVNSQRLGMQRFQEAMIVVGRQLGVNGNSIFRQYASGRTHDLPVGSIQQFSASLFTPSLRNNGLKRRQTTARLAKKWAQYGETS